MYFCRQFLKVGKSACLGNQIIRILTKRKEKSLSQHKLQNQVSAVRFPMPMQRRRRPSIESTSISPHRL